MSYSAGQVILHDEYNTFATGNADGSANNGVANINTIWGTGSGDYGYGQSSTLSSVTAGTVISATQWATMFSRFTSIASQQGTSVTAISNPTTGSTISAISTFASNLSSLYTNALNAAANGTDITTNGTITGTTNWTTSSSFTQTFTFPSANQARYFFNAGGHIRLSYARSGGTGNSKDTDWTALATAVGTLVITGSNSTKTIAGTSYTGFTKIGGSGSPTTLTTSAGFFNLTTSPTVVFKQYSANSPYTANYIQISLSVDNASTPTVLTVSVLFKDDAADTVVSPSDYASATALDIVDGTLTATHIIRPPSTSYLTNTWGTPAMNSVSWTQG